VSGFVALPYSPSTEGAWRAYSPAHILVKAQRSDMPYSAPGNLSAAAIASLNCFAPSFSRRTPPIPSGLSETRRPSTSIDALPAVPPVTMTIARYGPDYA
jgi:hypothetical protein